MQKRKYWFKTNCRDRTRNAGGWVFNLQKYTTDVCQAGKNVQEALKAKFN